MPINRVNSLDSILEKRKFVRLTRNMPVKIQDVSGNSAMDDNFQQMHATCKNISQGGMLIEVKNSKKDDRVLLRRSSVGTLLKVDIPDISRRLDFLGIPVRQVKRGNNFNLGIKFVEKDSSKRSLLSSYILKALGLVEEEWASPAKFGKKFSHLLGKIYSPFMAIRILGIRRLLRINKAKNLAAKLQTGYFETNVIKTLIKLGFFEQISENNFIDIDSFSEKKNLNKEILTSFCDYLYERKIFDKKLSTRKYFLAKKGLLIKNNLRGLFEIILAFENLFQDLDSLIKHKGERANMKNVYFEAKGTGNAAKQITYPLGIDLIKRRGFKRILDLGCGSADFLIELCKSLPEAKGFGVDFSGEAITYALDNVKRNRLGEKVILFKKDIFEIERIAGNINEKIDLITCLNLLHEFIFHNDWDVIYLLSKIKQVFGNTPLLISEFIAQEPQKLRKRPELFSELQLLHSLAEERQTGLEHWRKIFQEAGFWTIEERYFDFAKMVIYLIK